MAAGRQHWMQSSRHKLRSPPPPPLLLMVLLTGTASYPDSSQESALLSCQRLQLLHMLNGPPAAQHCDGYQVGQA